MNDRFRFGANWLDYLRSVRIELSKKQQTGSQSWLEISKGKTFLDVDLCLNVQYWINRPERIRALNRGQWVLCDRFTDSSEAYQGGGRELGSEIVLHKALCRDLQPDLTILMVSDVARTVARARRRNIEQSKLTAEDENRFEKENRAFYNRVMAAYLAIAQRDPRRVAPVDAADGIPKVQQKIFRVIEERLFPALSLNKKS